ncbi:hypothetical protein CRE_05835 [Caenorhabditis remanei]|uniref:Uncharacterized protein n=1 Tax=Caenorhabditis remanei TaxID=31234 RepID=E3MNL6_CAERE|nr:hypothetical protein CRE_05835 [Caenorhabditis remanei]
MDKEDGSIRCQIMWQLDQDKKYDEVTEHLLTGCLSCVTNPKKRFNGKEMLFPDAPPPWIKIPESEVSNPDAWKNYHKKRVHTQMTPEEFDQFLVDSDMTDIMICWEIAKFKRIERVAAWPMVREIRRKQKELRLEQERKDKEQRKKESEAKKEAEKLKKLDEKRKLAEKKQLKDDEKQEYLEKMAEEEKLLVEVLGEKDSDDDGELITSSQDSEAANDSETSELAENSKFRKPLPQKKEFNLRHAMPWSPSAYDLLCSDLRSIIDHSSQKRVIAMCQNLLYNGDLRHSGNRFELKVNTESESAKMRENLTEIV